MATVTLFGKIRAKKLQFHYAGHYFGARRTDTGWWIFIDEEYVGMTIDSPYNYAYTWLEEHTEDRDTA